MKSPSGRNLNVDKEMVTAVVAFGGNMESPDVPLRDRLERAILLMSEAELEVLRVSHWYRTPSYPKGGGSDFLNGAVAVETNRDPQDILAVLSGIELQLGRVRKKRWGARLVDLDVIAVGDLVLPDLDEQTRWRQLLPKDQLELTPGELILPHPRLQDRNFVLYPMRDVVPDWVHPVTGLSIDAMLAALPADQHAEISVVD